MFWLRNKNIFIFNLHSYLEVGDQIDLMHRLSAIQQNHVFSQQVPYFGQYLSMDTKDGTDTNLISSLVLSLL